MISDISPDEVKQPGSGLHIYIIKIRSHRLLQLSWHKPHVLGSGTPPRPHPNVLPSVVLCCDSNLLLASEMSGFFLSARTTNYVSE